MANDSLQKFRVRATPNGLATINEAVAAGRETLQNPTGFSTKPSSNLNPETLRLLAQAFEGNPDASFVRIDPNRENGYSYALDVRQRSGRTSRWYLHHTIDLNGSNAGSASFIEKGSPNAGVLDVRPRTQGGERFDTGDILHYIHHPTDNFTHEFTRKSYAALTPVYENGYSDAIVIKDPGTPDDVWYIKRDMYVRHEDGVRAVVSYLINKDDPSLQFRVEGKRQEILNMIELRHKDAASENADPAHIKSFDLPRDHIVDGKLVKGRPIAYLAFNGMLDKKNKEKFANDRAFQQAYPELLVRCGYDIVCPDPKNPVIELKDDPARQIREQIDQMHNLGVKDFYLHFDMHGTESGMSSHWDINGFWKMLGYKTKSHLGNEQLALILKDPKYKDCNFVLDSQSCQGGGLIAMMRDFKDLPGTKEGRIVAIAHTKESQLNNEHFSTVFSALLADMAANAPGAHKTFGSAYLAADHVVKRRFIGSGNAQYLDAEISISGGWSDTENKPLPSLRTAQSDAYVPDTLLAKAAKEYHTGNKPAVTVAGNGNPHHGLSGEANLSTQYIRT